MDAQSGISVAAISTQVLSLPDYLMPQDHLIIMTRVPKPGRTKTRLIPALGSTGAAALHQLMIHHQLNCVDRLRRARNVDVEVCYCGAGLIDAERTIGRGRRYRHQGMGDLGQRMERAVRRAVRRAAKRIVIIGTDCPFLDEYVLLEAFDGLRCSNVAIGPATDGGYYLLAMRQPTSLLFRNIAWGTDAVLLQTLDACHRLDLRVHLLPELSDVDKPEDLQQFPNLIYDLDGADSVASYSQSSI